MTTLTIPETTPAALTTTKSDYQPPQGYQVPQATVAAKIAHYPEEAQRAILDFAAILRQENGGRGWTLSEAAEQLSHVGSRAQHRGEGGAVSTATLSQLFNGKYASPVGIAKTLAEFVKTWRRRRLVGDRPLVATRMVETVGEICKAAAAWHRPAFIWGKTQEGKTTGLLNFAASHPGAIYYRTPASVSLHAGMRALVKAAGGTPAKNIEDTRAELWGSVTKDHVLLIDELHQAFTTWPKNAALRFWEVLRDLWDAKKCGLVICGTSEIAKQMRQGEFRELLKQLAERTRLHLDTDAAPSLAVGTNSGTVRDINAVLACYGLPALQVTTPHRVAKGSPEDVRRFEFFRDRIIAHSLGDIFETLDDAARFAGSGPVNFGHVDEAVQQLADMGCSL